MSRRGRRQIEGWTCRGGDVGGGGVGCGGGDGAF